MPKLIVQLFIISNVAVESFILAGCIYGTAPAYEHSSGGISKTPVCVFAVLVLYGCFCYSYVVEQIIDRKEGPDGPLYEVHWKGYSRSGTLRALWMFSLATSLVPIAIDVGTFGKFTGGGGGFAPV